MGRNLYVIIWYFFQFVERRFKWVFTCKFQTDSTIMSLNVQMNVRSIEDLIIHSYANKAVCGPVCHQKLYIKTSLILKESLQEALLTPSKDMFTVFYSLIHRSAFNSLLYFLQKIENLIDASKHAELSNEFSWINSIFPVAKWAHFFKHRKA